MATRFVEKAARIVVAQNPRVPNGDVGDLEVGIAAAIRGAGANVIAGRDACVAIAERPGGSG